MWAQGKGYAYQEGYCTVAVQKGPLAFQCSTPIDGRYSPAMPGAWQGPAGEEVETAVRQEPLFSLPSEAPH